MRTTSNALLVLVSFWVLSFPSYAQTSFYAGHAGSGGGEVNPGAFSSIDLATGAVTIIGTANASGGGVAGLASDGGTIYAALAVGGAAQLVTINPATGTIASTIGDVILSGGGACAIGDLAMAGGVLYGMTSNGSGHVCDGNSGGTLVTISTSTAVATALGRPMQVLFSENNVQGGLAVDGAGNLWFSPGWNHPDPGHLYVLNTTTGLVQSTLTLTGTFPNNEGANGLVWNPDDGQLYASFEQSAPGNTSLWSIDPTTGASVLVTASTAQLHDIVAFGAGGTIASAIPTMSAYGLALTALTMLLVAARRLRASARRR